MTAKRTAAEVRAWTGRSASERLPLRVPDGSSDTRHPLRFNSIRRPPHQPHPPPPLAGMASASGFQTLTSVARRQRRGLLVTAATRTLAPHHHRKRRLVFGAEEEEEEEAEATTRRQRRRRRRVPVSFGARDELLLRRKIDGCLAHATAV